MRQSLYQSLKDQSTVLRSNRFVFEGRCDLMSHGLNSLVSDPSVTDKNKKALLNLDSLVKKQFAPIISLITSNDVALNQTVKDKLDELQPVLESVYILIDTIYTAQMKQTVDLSYKAAYCATSLETQVLQIWMKKMEEFYSIFEYQSSNKIMVNFNQNPNFIAFWNLSETFTAQMNTCDTPTTKCVNGLVNIFILK